MSFKRFMLGAVVIVLVGWVLTQDALWTRTVDPVIHFVGALMGLPVNANY